LNEGGHSLRVNGAATSNIDGPWPFPYPLQHVNLFLNTEQLSAATLAPFLEGLLARPEGNIDTTLDLALSRPDPVQPWSTTLSGLVRLTGGSAYVPALGLELDDVSADVQATPKGDQTLLRISSLAAKARG
jgi:hypothetical protein